ncbi:hypothetical protein [Nitrosopumilus piranensis]|nr:hypothetical protein [Nitrosopumilus piranensis]
MKNSFYSLIQKIYSNSPITKTELSIFLIVFFVSFSITVYQYSTWETSNERIIHKSFALFSGDEPFYLQTASTITRHFSLHPDDFYKDPNKDEKLLFPDLYYAVDSCRLHHSLTARDGHCYFLQPGSSIIIAPGYFLGGILGSMITMNIIFALQGVLYYKILLNYTKKNIAFLGTLLFSFATIELVFSPRMYPDLLTGFFVLTAIYLFFKTEKTFLHISLIGAILGFMPFFKIPFLIFPLILLPVMAMILIQHRKFNRIFQLVGMFSIFFTLFLLLHSVGAPVEGGDPGLGGDYNVFFIQGISDSIHGLILKSFSGLSNLLFGQSYGLFLFSPIVLLSFFGLKFLWAKDRILTISIVSIVVLFLTSHSILIGNAAGWSLPSRYMLPILPLAIFPFAVLLEKYSRNKIFHLLLIFSTYIGVSFNLIFARTIYAHFFRDGRADIANQVYFGMAEIFPDVGVRYVINIWPNENPFFWIFVSVLISLFTLFLLYNHAKKFWNKSNIFYKIIILSILCSVLILFIMQSHTQINEFQIESELNHLYELILKREPSQNEIEHLKNIILNNTKTIDDVKEELLVSPEGIATKQITEVYNQILFREPDPQGLEHWKNAILDEGRSITWVEEMIKNSLEIRNLKN